MFREQERANCEYTSLPDDRYRLKYNTVIVTFQASHCDNLRISVAFLQTEVCLCYTLNLPLEEPRGTALLLKCSLVFSYLLSCSFIYFIYLLGLRQ
jgi:hypothetical protein